MLILLNNPFQHSAHVMKSRPTLFSMISQGDDEVMKTSEYKKHSKL